MVSNIDIKRFYNTGVPAISPRNRQAPNGTNRHQKALIDIARIKQFFFNFQYIDSSSQIESNNI